ncbi:MAG: MarR family transcriptional regulator [Eubacterium sp.]|nr:MarR family transcriptional regulator [Eubacterium sp.]
MAALTPKERLERNPLSALYSKFRVHYYRDVFKRINSRELSLTTTEVYCVEIIHNLGKPTIQEFANFIGISSPNATYKVNSLIKKGYVQKVQSDKDKREFYLDVTERYYRYYNINEKYLDIVENRLKANLSPEEFEMFNNTLKKIYNEMMPEVSLDNE